MLGDFSYTERFKLHKKFYVSAFFLLLVTLPEFRSLVFWNLSHPVRVTDWLESSANLLLGSFGFAFLLLSPIRAKFKVLMGLILFIALYQINLIRIRADITSTLLFTYLWEWSGILLYIPVLTTYAVLLRLDSWKKTKWVKNGLVSLVLGLAALSTLQTRVGGPWDWVIREDVTDRIRHVDFNSMQEIVEQCRRLSSEGQQSVCIKNVAKLNTVPCGEYANDRPECARGFGRTVQDESPNLQADPYAATIPY